jgi:hypothetical protein
MSTCEVVEDGVRCGKPAHGNDMCRVHNQRVYRTGTPFLVVKVKPTAPLRTCEVVENGVRCSKPYAQTGRCSTHNSRVRRRGDPLLVGYRGADHPSWLGENVGYEGAHLRITRALGPAHSHVCICGAPAQDYAYSNVCPDERCDIDGQNAGRPFCTHFDCYEPLCKPCHMVKDSHPFSRQKVSA